MASLEMERDGLRVVLTTGERWAALRRAYLVVRWEQILGVEVAAEPFLLVDGLRAPGLSIPWRTKIGTWRAAGRKTFAVTRKGQPGLRILLHGNMFDDVVLSAGGAAEWVSQISSRLDPMGGPDATADRG